MVLKRVKKILFVNKGCSDRWEKEKGQNVCRAHFFGQFNDGTLKKIISRFNFKSIIYLLIDPF